MKKVRITWAVGFGAVDIKMIIKEKAAFQKFWIKGTWNGGNYVHNLFIQSKLESLWIQRTIFTAENLFKKSIKFTILGYHIVKKFLALDP